MKARIPKHREFIINFPDSIPEAKANEGWATLLPLLRTARLTSRSCRKSMASSTPLSTFSNF